MPLKVTIFIDSSQQGSCQECFPPLGETVGFLQRHLGERYGEVDINYCDLADKDSCSREAALVEFIRAHSVRLPTVAIDGVLRFSGFPDFRAIVEAVETSREVGVDEEL